MLYYDLDKWPRGLEIKRGYTRSKVIHACLPNSAYIEKLKRWHYERHQKWCKCNPETLFQTVDNSVGQVLHAQYFCYLFALQNSFQMYNEYSLNNPLMGNFFFQRHVPTLIYTYRVIHKKNNSLKLFKMKHKTHICLYQEDEKTGKQELSLFVQAK